MVGKSDTPDPEVIFEKGDISTICSTSLSNRIRFTVCV